METIYKINEDECTRRENLPNLLEATIGRMAPHDPAMMLIINAVREFKAITSGDMSIDTSFKNSFLGNLKILYKQDPVLSSKVHLKICELCSQNLQCSQYQDYITQPALVNN